MIHLRDTLDICPAPIAERQAIGLHGQVGLGILDDGVDFQAVADDASILQQPLPVRLVELADLLGIEAGIGTAV